MDADLLLIQFQDFWKQFMDSSQQRMLIYQLVQMQFLKTVYGFFPTTDVNLSLVQTLLNFWKQITDASQQRMLIYFLFNFKISENSLWILPNNEW